MLVELMLLVAVLVALVVAVYILVRVLREYLHLKKMIKLVEDTISEEGG